jgi:hypothetical protein
MRIERKSPNWPESLLFAMVLQRADKTSENYLRLCRSYVPQRNHDAKEQYAPAG